MPSTDQGLLTESYKLVPRTLIFLTNEDNILLIKGSPNKRLWANLYNGIGGHLERGEDVLNSAKRELLEEVGIIPDNLWLCGIITIDTTGDTGIGIYVFRGECAQIPSVQSEEGSAEWVPINQISELPLVEDLPVVLPIVIARTPDAQPFFAHYHYTDEGKLRISFSQI